MSMKLLVQFFRKNHGISRTRLLIHSSNSDNRYRLCR
jgi:hypothetical protein